jgi:predicted phage tail protein
VTSGQLSSESDQDWFGFSMSSRGVVSVAFVSPGNYVNETHTVQVRDGSGTILASVDTGSDTVFQTGVSSAGPYYIVVRDGPDAFFLSGQYTITITNSSAQTTAETEPNNSSSTASPLLSGIKTFGQLLSQTDQDWFSFVTSGSSTVTVAFNAPGNYVNQTHTVQVVNGSGTILASVDTGSDTTFQTGVSTAGTYYVVVRHGPDAYFLSKQYGLTVTAAQPPPTTITSSIYSAVEIDWNSSASKSYIVEWTASLSPTNWLPLSSSLAGTGGGMRYFDSIHGQTRGFYRVKQY